MQKSWVKSTASKPVKKKTRQVLDMLRKWDCKKLVVQVLYCKGNNPNKRLFEQLVLSLCLECDGVMMRHDQAGHNNIERPITFLQRRCYWPCSYKDVTLFYGSYGRCGEAKIPHPIVQTLLGHLLASKPNQIVAMNFIILERLIFERKNVLVMMNVFSKFSVTLLIRNQTTQITAKVPMREWSIKYG